MLERSSINNSKKRSKTFANLTIAFIIVYMNTPLLTIQTQSDADQVLAKRIRLIYKEFGGLGPFFERLKQQRQNTGTYPHKAIIFPVNRMSVIAKNGDKGVKD